MSRLSENLRQRLLIDTSLCNPALLVAASRLSLQDSPTMERNARKTSSSRQKLAPRLYLPRPGKRLLVRMEKQALGSVGYKSWVVYTDIHCYSPVQETCESTDSLNRLSFLRVFLSSAPHLKSAIVLR